VESLASHTAGITSLTFSSDGKALLSSGWDGRVIIWDVTQKKISQEWRFPGGVYQAAFGPTGRQVISANGNGSVYVWNTD
jgi:WD40 repeat protein